MSIEELHADVAVVGGGPAGVAGALRAADLGASTVLIEADRLGGTCVNSGCVPTRVLAKAARLVRDTGAAGEYGIAARVEGFDWDRLRNRVTNAVRQIHDAKSSASRLDAAGVRRIEGRARFRGPGALAVDDHARVLAERVLLCVGGRPSRPPIPGADLAILPDEVLDLPMLPERVAIVGSGATGVQLATVFSSLGAHVTIVEVAPRLLPSADRDVGDGLAAAFVEQGMTVALAHGVTAIEATDDGRRRRVRLAPRGADGGLATHGDARRLDTGDAERRDDGTTGAIADHVEVDAVVLATGWPAAVDGLGLEHAGVDVEGGRIPVDEFFRSSAAGVFAPGDANGAHMLVQSAEFEAVAAATNAVLGPSQRAPHALLPWGGFTNPDIAGVGMTEDDARARGAAVRVARVDYREMERPIIDGRTQGMLKLLCDRDRRTVLGAHAVGEQAVEVIQAVTTAMAANADVATLARVEYAYPSYTAIVGRAARRLLRDDPAPARRRGGTGEDPSATSGRTTDGRHP